MEDALGRGHTVSTREDHKCARWATVDDDLGQSKAGVGEATRNAQRELGSIPGYAMAIGDVQFQDITNGTIVQTIAASKLSRPASKPKTARKGEKRTLEC